MTTLYVGRDGKVTTRKKEPEKKVKKEASYRVDKNGNITLIPKSQPKTTVTAPVTTTKEEDDDKWFKSGAFSDGWQFGDIAKTLLGTAGDIVVNVGKGAGNLVEGITDLGVYGVASVSDLLGADDFAEKTRNLAKKNSVNDALSGIESYVDRASLLGDKSDSISQGLGYVGGILATGGLGAGAGLGTIGTTALTTGTTFASSMGGGMSEAYQGNATDEEALSYGLIKGVVEAGSELIFGGLGKVVGAVGLSKGISNLDDALASKITSKITNQIHKNFIEYGIKASAEGVEEVLAGIGTAWAKSSTYMDEEDFWDILKDENLLEQFIAGAVTSGIAQSGYIPAMKNGSLREANATGRDFITGKTKSEQMLTDTLVNERVTEATKQKAIEIEVEKAIAEREKAQGGKLTDKNKEALKNSIMQKIESGEIDVSTVKLDKKAIGKIETEVEQNLEQGEYELSKLESILSSDKTAQIEQLEKTLENTKDEKQKAQLQKQISELKTAKYTELKGMLKDNKYLVKSSYEAKMSGESYKYTENVKEGDYAKAVRESAKTHLSNNTYSRNYVDAMAKLSEDTKRNYRFVNNNELAEQGDLVEDRDVGGLVKVDENGVETVLINVDSKQAPYRVLVHETKHVLEGSDLNDSYNKLLFDYAKQTGDYDTFREQIKKLYETTDEAKITKELSAELSAYYFSNDTKFLETITKDKTILQKIKEVIDDFVLRFKGTKQEKQYRELQKKFEQLLKNAPKTESKKNSGSTQYTLYLTENDIPNYLKAGSRENKNRQSRYEEGAQMIISSDAEFDSFVTKSIEGDPDNMVAYGKVDNQLAEKVKDKSDSQIDITDAFLELLSNDIQHAYREHSTAKEEGDLDMSVDDLKYALKNVNTAEVVSAKTYKDGAKRVTLAIPMDNGVMMLVELASKSAGSLRLKTGWKITSEKYKQKYKSSSSTTGNNSSTKTVRDNTASTDRITQNSKNVNKQFSLSDTDSKGRKLTPKQQEYLKDVTPELKDENGNIKVMYHGTANDFTVFDPFLQGGKNGTAEGYGIYFTDIPEITETYGDKRMEGYLKVTHPATSNKKTIKKNDLVKLIKATSETEAKRMVEAGDYDNVTDALRDTWVSNYVYTYDKPMDASYREVADSIIRTSDNDMAIVQEVMGGLAIRNYDQAYRFYDTLKSTLGIDGFITEWESDLIEGGKAQIVVAFDSNQFKSVTNENPTDNPDINMSLSDGIAPTQKMLQDLRVGGRDIAPMPETVEKMPISESKTEKTPNEYPDDFAPLTEEMANERDAHQNRLFSLNENDMPSESEIGMSIEEADSHVGQMFYNSKIEAEDPFEGRDIKAVGNRKVKAYMYENPEVKPFFQNEAKIMLTELNDTIKGERVVNADVLYHTNGEAGIYGTKRFTSDDIAYLLDDQKYSYADIKKGLNAIIEDHGAENNAISKRIEFILNDRLGKGYKSFPEGYEIPANQDYLNALTEKQITEYSDEANRRFFESLAETYTEDIAPIREDVSPSRQYEAIKPAPQNEQEMSNNKMARVKEPNRVQASNTEAKMRRWVETSTDSEVVDGKILPEDLDLSKIIYEPIPNKVTLSKANSKLDVLGYDEALTTFNSKLANNKVELEDIALGERLLQEAMKKGDHATAGELIQNIAILGTELGQKVQALSIIQRLTPEGQLKMLYKTVRRGKVKGDKAFEGVELTQEMIDHILKTYKTDGTYDQNELNKAVEDVKKDIAKSMKVSGIDKVNAYRYLSMLGNPKTHIRNIVSNVAMKGTLAVKNVVARTVEDIAPIKDKTKTWKRATDEVKAFADKTTLEMKDVISEDTKYSEEASIKSKRDMFKNQILNKVYNFNNDLMAKEDWWFSKSAYKNSLSEFLTANGIKTNEDIANNPKIVEKAKAYALEQSQIATFRQYSWLANKIREIESKNVGTEIAVGSILPFKKTPINIAKAGLSYSPLGFAKSLTYDMYKMKKGEIQASQVVDNLAQGVTGTALTLVGYMLAMAGVLNGGGEDDKEGSYDYQLGKQSYSLTFGGNTYSLSWLSPVAMPLFVGANAYEQLIEGEEWNGDVVMETLAQTLDPLSEMSFLSSLDSVLSSYDSGVEKFAGIGEAMLQNYATQFIPTLSSQLASTLDDKKRSTKVAGDSGFKIVDETINKLVYKIPFLRETLEPSTDIWGNEVKQSESVISRALENFIAPYSRKGNISTNIDEEIKDLYAQTGDNGIIPSVPYNYVNYDGEKYEMSAKEYTNYKKTYGQTAYDLLEELFRTTTYQNATSEDKAEMVNDVYAYARDEAKREYLEKEGVTYTNATKDGTEYYKENSIKGAIENDMMLEEFDLYSKNPSKYAVAKAIGGYDIYKTYASELYNLEADKDANGKTINGSRKEKVVNYINNLTIDYGAKLLLFKSEYNADNTYNYEIIEYLNNREDISYQEMKTILEELGFTVGEDGTIYWD